MATRYSLLVTHYPSARYRLVADSSDLCFDLSGQIFHIGFGYLAKDLWVGKLTVSVVLETGNEMNVRMSDTDASGVSNDPVSCTNFLECFRNAPRPHKQEPGLRRCHVPYPAMMRFWNHLRVAGIERVLIQKCKELRIFIDDVMRGRLVIVRDRIVGSGNDVTEYTWKG